VGGRGLAWGTTAGRAACLTEPWRALGGCASPQIYHNRERGVCLRSLAEQVRVQNRRWLGRQRVQATASSLRS
jgi:hypothetical protein